MKKISIIIPVYNGSEYIERCILSCETQNLDKNEFEIIVVNDGSTDNTLHIISSLCSSFKNIKIINVTNQGQSVARNIAIQYAEAEYMWFVDADDCISYNCLSKIYEILKSNDLDALCVYKDANVSFIKDAVDTSIRSSEIVNGEIYLTNYTPVTLAPWGYVFSKEFWNSHDFMFIPGIYYEDAQLIPIVLSYVTKICVIDSCAYYNYITRNGSTMLSPINNKKIKGRMEIVNTHLRHSKIMETSRLRNYFNLSATYSYIEGIKISGLMNGLAGINNFCESIIEKPKQDYPSENVLKKLLCKLFLRNPQLAYIVYSKIARIKKFLSYTFFTTNNA